MFLFILFPPFLYLCRTLFLTFICSFLRASEPRRRLSVPVSAYASLSLSRCSPPSFASPQVNPSRNPSGSGLVWGKTSSVDGPLLFAFPVCFCTSKRLRTRFRWLPVFLGSVLQIPAAVPLWVQSYSVAACPGRLRRPILLSQAAHSSCRRGRPRLWRDPVSSAVSCWLPSVQAGQGPCQVGGARNFTTTATADDHIFANPLNLANKENDNQEKRTRLDTKTAKQADSCSFIISIRVSVF